MVAYFKQKHNSTLSKHISFVQILVLLFGLFVQVTTKAEHNSIIINNTDTTRLLSNEFSVYYNESRVLTYEEFKKTRHLLPYHKYSSPNYGSVSNGAWLYSRLENRSDISKWMLEIRYSQLQYADVYVKSEDSLIYSNSDGNQNKTSPFPLPSFELELPQDIPLEIYVYVNSSSMNLLAPIYLQNSVDRKTMTMLDFSIWGIFYGATLVLFLYATTFVIKKSRLIGGVYLAHLFVLLMFQFLWSGHSVLLGSWMNTLFIYIRAESMVFVITITSTILNLLIVPKNKYKSQLGLVLTFSIYINLFFFFAFFIPIIPDQIKLPITYILGFGGIILNFILCIPTLLYCNLYTKTNNI